MTMVIFLKKEIRDMIEWYLEAGLTEDEIRDAFAEHLVLLEGDAHRRRRGPPAIAAKTTPRLKPKRMPSPRGLKTAGD